jgi:hypothetical protein
VTADLEAARADKARLEEEQALREARRVEVEARRGELLKRQTLASKFTSKARARRTSGHPPACTSCRPLPAMWPDTDACTPLLRSLPCALDGQ